MNQIDQFIVRMDWAERYGFEEAALLWWIVHWIKRSTANGTNYHDGSTWIYNSRRAWAELFPCWSEKQIYRILDNLIDRGVIKKGEYNTNKYDRTKWYALRDEQLFGVRLKSDSELGNSTVPNGTMDSPEPDSQLSQTGQPIPIKNNSKEVQKEVNTPYLPLSELLRDKIKQSGTDAIFKETDLIKWSNQFRLMVEQDGRTVDQIKAKITAVFEDSFWSKQIRSVGTLREKWKLGRLDRLNASTVGDNSETDAQEVERTPEPTDPWKRFLGTSTMSPSTKAENHLIKIWERTFENQDYKKEPWYGGAGTEDQYKRAWETLSVVKDKKQAAEVFVKIHWIFEATDGY